MFVSNEMHSNSMVEIQYHSTLPLVSLFSLTCVSPASSLRNGEVQSRYLWGSMLEFGTWRSSGDLSVWHSRVFARDVDLTQII